MWTSNYNWTTHDCSNYQWGVVDALECDFWHTKMLSTTKANERFPWVNPEWDTEVANIWWKQYFWTDSSTACTSWYRLPTDADFEALEIILNGWISCGWYWDCPGIWWEFHSTVHVDTSMVEALQIPLAGYIDSDGKFWERWFSAYLWSDTHISWYQGALQIYSPDIYIIPTWYDPALSGMSVRCIKE